MNSISSVYLWILLCFLILVSGFFSASETGMMAINRYRLRHLASNKNRAAMRVNQLLERPDRLLGIILIGNTFANILASAIATLLAVKIFGDIGIAIATIVLTFAILIFAEVAPKTIAANYPQHIAFSVSLPLKCLLFLLYPLIWFTNTLANSLLRILQIPLKKHRLDPLNRDELRTVVYESEGHIPADHQGMLLGVLDLVKVTVDDIMVPLNEIMGIDLDDEPEAIIQQLVDSNHTRLPVYRESLDNVAGILHARNALNLIRQGKLSKQSIIAAASDVLFVPEGTLLSQQLLNFQKKKARIGLVVDEYGDIQGLVTMEDILEEIVGEFTTDVANLSPEVYPQKDGSFLVDGSANIRELNRDMQWKLPVDGPKTMNGLITEYLEAIPASGISMRIAGYPIEVVQVKDNLVKMAKINPKERVVKENEE